MPKESLKRPCVLITGGAGLIGTAAKTEFENNGWKVITLDKEETDLAGRIIDHVADVVDFQSWPNILKNVNGILHLAAVSRVIDAEQNKEECTRVNVVGTEKLLIHAAMSECKWFVFGSSREVYGEPASLPVSEEDGVAPINHYGYAKVTGETLVKDHCESNEMVHSILRFSNVYGHPGDHKTRLINAFVLNALQGQPLEIHGGGQIFDFTYIEDTVQAIYRAAELLNHSHQSLPPMHVLRGEAVTIEALAQMTLEVTGSQSEVIYTAGRTYDVERFHGDPKRMNAALGIECVTGIRAGLEKTVTLHKNRLKVKREIVE